MIGIGDIVDQRYEITQLLGAGGMGKVYKARRCAGGLSSEVAIKVLEPGVASWRFEREAQILEQLRHDNICRVLDLLQHDGQHAMVLEYLDGQPLDRALEQQGRLSWPDVKVIAADVLAGLAEAHGRGIVHRDIKPANLMFMRTATGGKTVIMDFGIARDQGRDGSGTSAGNVVGTWRYAAPEQIKGEDLGPPCDLYALGVTLYELLTGGALFPIDTAKEYEWMHAHVHTPPDWNQLEALHGKGAMRFLQKALQKKPADRYATAQAMLQALTDIPTNSADGSLAKKPWQFVMPLLGRAGQLSRPAARQPKPRERPGRPLSVLVLLGLSGAAALGGVGFIGIALWRSDTPAPLARQLPSLPTPAPASVRVIPAEPERSRIENVLPKRGEQIVTPYVPAAVVHALPPDPPYTPPVNSSRPSTMVSGSREPDTAAPPPRTAVQQPPTSAKKNNKLVTVE